MDKQRVRDQGVGGLLSRHFDIKYEKQKLKVLMTYFSVCANVWSICVDDQDWEWGSSQGQGEVDCDWGLWVSWCGGGHAPRDYGHSGQTVVVMLTKEGGKKTCQKKKR